MMEKGDVVLVPFPFTDLSSTKNRPALVLVSTTNDVTLSFITTKIHWQEEWDLLLNPSDKNGLKKVSLVRLAKMTTLEKSLVLGKLGSLTSREMTEVDHKLKVLFQIEQ